MTLPQMERWWDEQLQPTFACAWAKITMSRMLSGGKRLLDASDFRDVKMNRCFSNYINLDEVGEVKKNLDER